MLVFGSKVQAAAPGLVVSSQSNKWLLSLCFLFTTSTYTASSVYRKINKNLSFSRFMELNKIRTVSSWEFLCFNWISKMPSQTASVEQETLLCPSLGQNKNLC